MYCCPYIHSQRWMYGVRTKAFIFTWIPFIFFSSWLLLTSLLLSHSLSSAHSQFDDMKTKQQQWKKVESWVEWLYGDVFLLHFILIFVVIVYCSTFSIVAFAYTVIHIYIHPFIFTCGFFYTFSLHRQPWNNAVVVHKSHTHIHIHTHTHMQTHLCREATPSLTLEGKT